MGKSCKFTFDAMQSPPFYGCDRGIDSVDWKVRWLFAVLDFFRLLQFEFEVSVVDNFIGRIRNLYEGFWRETLDFWTHL